MANVYLKQHLQQHAVGMAAFVAVGLPCVDAITERVELLCDKQD